MKPMNRFFTLIGLVLLGSSCGCSLSRPGSANTPTSGVPSPSQPAELQVRSGDDGRQIDLSRGQILVVELESSPGTGFSWVVDQIPDRVLQQEGESQFKSDSTLLGAPSVQTIRFRVIGAGQGTLRLAYRRPWEKDVAPTKTFVLNINSR